MASTSLTESGWKAIVQKSKIKDNGLQKALAAYENLEEDNYDGRLKAIGSISQLANALKKAKDVAAAAPALKYLADVLDDADSDKSDINKAKTIAVKTALIQKKADD